MSQAESVNTMMQGAFVLVDANAGRYALQISGLTAGAGGVPIETAIPVVTRSTSVYATGKSSAPGAGTTVAQTTSLAQGTWDVEVTTFIGGTTVAATEIDNMELFLGAASQGRIVNAVPGTAGSSGAVRTKLRFDGTGVIAVKANGAATAGSIYVANIVVTRIN